MCNTSLTLDFDSSAYLVLSLILRDCLSWYSKRFFSFSSSRCCWRSLSLSSAPFDCSSIRTLSSSYLSFWVSSRCFLPSARRLTRALASLSLATVLFALPLRLKDAPFYGAGRAKRAPAVLASKDDSSWLVASTSTPRVISRSINFWLIPSLDYSASLYPSSRTWAFSFKYFILSV